MNENKKLELIKEIQAIAKRISMSFEGEQESLSIGLLMRHGIRFVLLKPRKIKVHEKNSIDALFMKIQEIHVGTKKYNFDEIIKKNVNEGNLIPKIETFQKRKVKYQKRNIISATNNFLIDLLKKIGYKIEFKNSRKTSCVLKMNRMFSIYGNNIEIKNNKMISEFGMKINKKLKNIFEKNSLKREMPFEFGYENISEFFDESESFDLLIEDFIHEYRGFESNQKVLSVNKNIEINKNAFIKEGYNVKHCPFGWFATELRKKEKI